jgi:hypothetical protein
VGVAMDGVDVDLLMALAVQDELQLDHQPCSARSTHEYPGVDDGYHQSPAVLQDDVVVEKCAVGDAGSGDSLAYRGRKTVGVIK